MLNRRVEERLWSGDYHRVVACLVIIVFVRNVLPLQQSMRRIDNRTLCRIRSLLWAGQARVKYTEGSEVR